MNFVPIVITQASESITFPKTKKIYFHIAKVLLIVVLFINTTALVLANIKPAGIGRGQITESIHALNDKDKLNVIYKADVNPYAPWGLKANFYKEENAAFFEIGALEQNDMQSRLNESRNVLVVTMKDLTDKPIENLVHRLHMTEQCKSIPGFMLPFLKIYGYKTENIMVLYSN